MAKPDWATVLRIFYEQNIMLQNLEPGEGSPLVSETQLDEETVSEQLEYLRDVGLLEVELIPVTYPHSEGLNSSVEEPLYSLSEKGFDVAHERELTEKQNTTNLILAALTAGLFFTAAVQAIGAYYSVPASDQAMMGAGTAVIGLLVIIILIAMFRR